jgi:hypothetical protein
MRGWWIVVKVRLTTVLLKQGLTLALIHVQRGKPALQMLDTTLL